MSIDSKQRMHNSPLFNINVTYKSIIIEFERFSILCKVSLKNLCLQKITTFSDNQKEDFRKQVILPLVKLIEHQQKDLLSQINETIHLSSNEIVINSIDKKDIKDGINDFILSLQREKDKQATHKALMAQKPYHELFPCRNQPRQIMVYIAPTNSGKTYQSCNNIKELIHSDDFATAQCFFPLRALAAQLKDEFVEDGIPCDLITGEERELEVGARVTSCTTEILDPGEFKDLIFIDECQMIFDPNKQPAYTRAILGAYCDKLILAVAPYYAEALIELLKTYTNDDISVVELERLCPLEPCGNATFNDIEKGDVIVAYRTKSIHLIAEELNNRGLKTGVIYGRMSPSARRSMIKNFMEKDCDCLVATDAIGMGLSIPAKRVFIAEGTKYDGTSVRPLEEEEMRQVAGRAGRFGFYDIGYYGAIDISNIMEGQYSSACLSKISDAMIIKDDFKAPDELRVMPDKNIMRSVGDLNLEATLNVWKKSVTSHANIHVSEDNFDILINKAKFLDTCDIDKRDTLVNLLYIVFPEHKDDLWKNIYESLVTKVLQGNKVSIDDFYMMVESDNYSKILECENMSMFLTLLSQFQRIFADLLPSEEDIRICQEETGEKLSLLLLKLYASAK